MAETRITNSNNASIFNWKAILRIALGFILIWKGVNFIRDITAVELMVEQTSVGVFSDNARALALFVSWATLLCGLFITIGLFTRIASIVMLPIVIVAIVFINAKNVAQNTSELILTIVVLLLLILFAIKGSGLFSADEYFRRGRIIDRGL